MKYASLIGCFVGCLRVLEREKVGLSKIDFSRPGKLCNFVFLVTIQETKFVTL